MINAIRWMPALQGYEVFYSSGKRAIRVYSELPVWIQNCLWREGSVIAGKWVTL